MFARGKQYIVDISSISPELEEIVGAEGLTLADLKATGVNVPPAFVISSQAFDDFVTAANIVEPIAQIIQPLVADDAAQLKIASERIGDLISKSSFPSLLINPLLQAYRNLSGFNDKYVAVKPSWVLDYNLEPDSIDITDKLNVKGEANLLYAIKQVWCSLFSPEALQLRLENNYNGSLAIAILIQKMVQAEVSGTAFSIDPVTNSTESIVVEAILGLSVPGVAIEPDIYTVKKQDLVLAEKVITAQDYMILKKGRAKPNEDPNMRVTISPEWRKKQKLDDQHVLNLAKIAQHLEQQYQRPLEINWAFETGNLHVISVNELVFERTQSFQITPHVPEHIEQVYNDPIETISEEVVSDEELDALIHNPFAAQLTETRANPGEEQDSAGKIDHIEQEVNRIAAQIQSEIRSTPAKSLETEKPVLPPLPELPKVDTLSSIYLDISEMTSTKLVTATQYAGAVLDGTQTVIRHKILPDTITNNKALMDELVEKYTQEIVTAAKAVGPKPLVYKFSDISPVAADKHFGASGLNYDGAERFVNNPTAMLIEVIAVKRAKHVHNAHNLRVVLPKLRSVQEMFELKKMLSSQNLRRSATLKVYAEIAFPSFLFDLEDESLADIDGLVINFPELSKHMVARTELSEKDYINVFHALGMIEEGKLQAAIILPAHPSALLLHHAAKSGFNQFIFHNTPTAEELVEIKKSEQPVLTAPSKKKRGRKPKSLTKK